MSERSTSELRPTPSMTGQVRSEYLICTFRANCCSSYLSRAQVPAVASSSVRDRKKDGDESKGGLPALAGTREYEQSDQNQYQTEGGLRCYGIWNVP